MMRLLVATTLAAASSAAPAVPKGSPPSSADRAAAIHAAGGSTDMDDLVGAELRTQNFYHVPGPNPILTVGTNTSWDGLELECAGGVYHEYDVSRTASLPTLHCYL